MGYLGKNEVWCNGSTTVFGTVCLGSNPSTSSKKIKNDFHYYLRYQRYLLFV